MCSPTFASRFCITHFKPRFGGAFLGPAIAGAFPGLGPLLVGLVAVFGWVVGCWVAGSY